MLTTVNPLPILTLDNIEPYYEDIWNRHQVRKEWNAAGIMAAKSILAGRLIYEKLCQNINAAMPWYVPGILHKMECNCNFKQHLHNGDPLSHRTTSVPTGRPIKGNAPFTWLDSAADALTMPGIAFNKYRSWSLAEILYRFECYNGLGYRKRGIYSPYLWAGTNFYTTGKYDSDGHFNPDLKSEQVGGAVLLRYVTDKTMGIAV
jgi:lysozyme family protein